MKNFIMIFFCFLFLSSILYFMWSKRLDYFTGSSCNFHEKKEQNKCYQVKAVRSGSLILCDKISEKDLKIDCYEEVEEVYGE